jgi:hypothetical protein
MKSQGIFVAETKAKAGKGREEELKEEEKDAILTAIGLPFLPKV